jgi:DNA-directed RNA polymerase alpha subunit
MGAIRPKAEVAPKPRVSIVTILSDPTFLARSIDDLGLSVRSLNSLKNSSIRTIGDLVALSPKQLSESKNIGDLAMCEIGGAVGRAGLGMGMKWQELDGVVYVTDRGFSLRRIMTHQFVTRKIK